MEGAITWFTDKVLTDKASFIADVTGKSFAGVGRVTAGSFDENFYGCIISKNSDSVNVRVQLSYKNQGGYVSTASNLIDINNITIQVL